MNLARPKAIACPLMFIRVCIDKRELSTMTAKAPSDEAVPSAEKLRIPIVCTKQVKSSATALRGGLHPVLTRTSMASA